MPNCDFYAAGEDYRIVLEYLFATNECRIFESCSPVDASNVREFQSVSDIVREYAIDSWLSTADEWLSFRIYPVAAKGQLHLKKLDYDPVRYKGTRFRHRLMGWGLIDLDFHVPQNGTLSASRAHHKSEKRVGKWAGQFAALGPVSGWDWTVVTSFSRRLNRFIGKQAVDKIRKRCVLPGADAFLNADSGRLG
jgi:hypothetical protein